MYTLSVFIHYGDSASHCMYSMHSTMHAHWHQKINNTKHYSHSNKPVSVDIVKFCSLWRCCSWYIQLVKYIVLSILLHKRITSYQSDFELWRSNSQQQSVNHFFSGFFRHFILRQIQLQCTAMVCILHGDESFSWWFRYYLHPCSICDTFTYFV